ncbi:hypothetical protein Pcinc_028261 [Petrolisthes cinctipes]|uniref:Uncharacterized protein n=1 Tax=Petrolisthes cinctipes TaxID=88211 RepID=A0AAE1F2P8_PETCI|nr:hypothetical protein Pcinc_028261 [Petrolisthes cinctipes]
MMQSSGMVVMLVAVVSLFTNIFHQAEGKCPCPILAHKQHTGSAFKCECKAGYVINKGNTICLRDNEDECLSATACTSNHVCCNSATGRMCISWADVKAKFPADKDKEPTAANQTIPALEFRLGCRSE